MTDRASDETARLVELQRRVDLALDFHDGPLRDIPVGVTHRRDICCDMADVLRGGPS